MYLVLPLYNDLILNFLNQDCLLIMEFGYILSVESKQLLNNTDGYKFSFQKCLNNILR